MANKTLSSYQSVVNLSDYAAPGDVSSAAMAAAISACYTNHGSYFNYGRTLYIPAGVWNFDQTILFSSILGLKVIGAGYDTVLRWRGNATDALIKFSHCQHCTLSDLYIYADSQSYPLDRAIWIVRENAAGANLPPITTTIRNVYIDGTSMTDGIVINGENTHDANTDFNLFENVEIINYNRCGWVMEYASQSYGNKMVNCRALGNNSTSQYAVKTADLYAGNYHWSGGAVYGNKVSDFKVGHSVQPYIIEFVNSENSARFAVSTAQFVQLEIRGVRYAANEIHADGNCVDLYAHRMHLNIHDSSFGDAVVPTGRCAFKVWSQTPAKSHFAFERNRVYSSDENLWPEMIPAPLSGLRITDEQTLDDIVL